METEFGPTLTLTTFMGELSVDQAVKIARELSLQLGGDPENFHGDIWPGNIRLDGDGKAVLGKGSTAPVAQRTPSQIEYLSPEYFWDNSGSAPSDVYSLGLLLYALCNHGRLPFQPLAGELTDKDRSMALRRRMKGETVPALEGVSSGLAAVLQKALAYEPEDRYLTAREFLRALSETTEALPIAVGDDIFPQAGEAAVFGEAEDEVGQKMVNAEKHRNQAREDALRMAESTMTPSAEQEKRNNNERASTDDKKPDISTKPGTAQLSEKLKSLPDETSGTQGRRAEQGKKSSKNRKSPAVTQKRTASGQASKANPAVAGRHADVPPAGSAAGAADVASVIVNERSTAEEVSAGQAQRLPGQATDGMGSGKASDAPSAVVTHEKAAHQRGSAAEGKKAQQGLKGETEPSPDVRAYNVQKDFEQNGRRSNRAVAPASMRKKRSAAAPVICVVAALVAIGGATAALLYSRPEEISQPFVTIEPNAEPTTTPVVITTAPSPTSEPEEEPTPEPTTAPEETIMPEETVEPEQTARPDQLGSTHEDAVENSGSGTGRPADDTGAGNGTNTGTSGPGNENAAVGSGNGGSNTNTGSGGSSGGGSDWGSSNGNGAGGGNTGGGGGSNPPFTVTPASGTVYIQGIGVNIRSGPSTAYRVIGSANTGYSLQRTGKVNNWTRVAYGAGSGYVYSQYIVESAPATATPVPTAEPVPTTTPDPTPEVTPGSSPEPTAAPVPESLYTVHTGDLTFEDAKEAAEAAGLDLAVVHSDNDFASLERELEDSGLSYAWLGAFFDDSTGEWQWLDGSSISLEDSHWGSFYPQAGDDELLLAKQDGIWQYISVSSANFDPSADTYAGKLGYVTKS